VVDDCEEVFEAEAIDVFAHFVQIFEVFVAAFANFSALAFELVDDFLVASEVGASVGFSNQIQDGFQLFESFSEIGHFANFLFQSFLVGSCWVLGESVDQKL